MLKLALSFGYIFLLTLYVLGPFIILLKRLADDAGGKKKLWGTYGLLFLSGAVSTAVALALEMGADWLLSPDMSTFSGCFITGFFEASFIEEGLKFATFFLFVVCSKRFIRYVRGASFAAFVSMGFAFVENLGYVFSAETSSDAFALALVRALTSVPGHFVFSVFMGYFLAKAVLGAKKGQNVLYNDGLRYASDKRKKGFYKNLALSFCVPFFAHGLYDFLLMVGETPSPFRGLAIVAWLFFLLAIFYAAKCCVDDLKYKDAAIREVKNLSENYLYRSRR